VQQSTAYLHFAWRTTSLRVGGRAARRCCLPGLRRGGSGRQAGATVLSCLVWRCELSPLNHPTCAFCVGVRPAVAPTHSDAGRTVGRSGRLSSHRHTRHDKTVLSVSCLVRRCELDDCSERVRTSNFLSATVLSCRESSSHRRSGRDTDKTRRFCRVWRGAVN